MKLILIVVVALYSLVSTASSEALFKQNFDSIYVEGRCGDNIRNFAKLLKKSGEDLTHARIIEITNKGYSVFGLVNVEYARQSGPLVFDPVLQTKVRSPGERNWYHHVIFYHKGMIYDFDFGNRPNVVSVETYFKKMFFEEERSGYGVHFVGEDQKRKDYLLKVRDAISVIDSHENNSRSPEGDEFSLGEFLNLF